MVVEGGMRSVPVVVVEEGWEVSGADGGVLVSSGVSPFAQAGLDEAFGLPIGLGRIGLGADVLEAKALASVAEGDGGCRKPAGPQACRARPSMVGADGRKNKGDR